MFSVQCLLLFCVISFQSVVLPSPVDNVRRTKDCIRDSGVSTAALRGVSIGNFENDPILKDYLLCVSKTAGFQSEDGYLQSDTIRVRLRSGHYSADTIEEMMQRCNHQKETPQETAYQLLKCVYKVAVNKRFS